MAFQHILVPVDYSENSRVSLEYASRLAQECGADLTIVHVWDRPAYVSDTVMVGHGPSQRPLGELIRENAERDMREFLATLTLPTGIQVRERLISGDPASAILKHVASENYDLIVVGTHGRTGIAHMLLGSVAERLVRHSSVPVLTVPIRKH